MDILLKWPRFFSVFCLLLLQLFGFLFCLPVFFISLDISNMVISLRECYLSGFCLVGYCSNFFAFFIHFDFFSCHRWFFFKSPPLLCRCDCFKSRNSLLFGVFSSLRYDDLVLCSHSTISVLECRLASDTRKKTTLMKKL